MCRILRLRREREELHDKKNVVCVSLFSRITSLVFLSIVYNNNNNNNALVDGSKQLVLQQQ